MPPQIHWVLNSRQLQAIYIIVTPKKNLRNWIRKSLLLTLGKRFDKPSYCVNSCSLMIVSCLSSHTEEYSLSILSILSISSHLSHLIYLIYLILSISSHLSIYPSIYLSIYLSISTDVGRNQDWKSFGSPGTFVTVSLFSIC